MAKGPRYKVPRRRRREGKTNYHKRYRMVFSRRLRFVIRKTNKYIDIKIIQFDPKGDITLVSAHSRELVTKYGWKGGTSSTPAAYLTGYLAALRALKKGIREAVADIGLHRPVKGSRVFAAVKGGLDAGLEIPVSPEVLPDDSRVRGEHIAEWASSLKENSPELFEKQFSSIIKNGLDPQEYSNHFEEVLGRIKRQEGE